MCLGALLDLGVDAALFTERMAGLRLPVGITVRRVRRGGFGALKVDVDVRRHDHVERNFADIEKIVLKSRFKPAVKDRALTVFKRLFEAEAKVHGRRFAEAHLHEAGADDALVDVVGTAFLLDELGIADLYCSPLNVGSGWVQTSHGRLAVPPPAVAELLQEGAGLRGLGRIGARHPHGSGHRLGPGQGLQQAPRARLRPDRPGGRDQGIPRDPQHPAGLLRRRRRLRRGQERLRRRGDDRRRDAPAPGPLPRAGFRGGRPRRHPLPRRHEEEPPRHEARGARHGG